MFNHNRTNRLILLPSSIPAGELHCSVSRSQQLCYETSRWRDTGSEDSLRDKELLVRRAVGNRVRPTASVTVETLSLSSGTVLMSAYQQHCWYYCDPYRTFLWNS